MNNMKVTIYLMKTDLEKLANFLSGKKVQHFAYYTYQPVDSIAVQITYDKYVELSDTYHP